MKWDCFRASFLMQEKDGWNLENKIVGNKNERIIEKGLGGERRWIGAIEASA